MKLVDNRTYDALEEDSASKDFCTASLLFPSKVKRYKQCPKGRLANLCASYGIFHCGF